ncbi:MAG: acetyl-CoA C-acyltransferase [Alphaproteobacteria bacterium]|nr:MAG: acetyl-CoA C-acyltransferase [Alphaproteobacteria bacterium]
MSKNIYIAGAARTPMGGFQGELSSLTAPQLGSYAIKAALERSGIKSDSINEVLMGCVLPAGLGQAPARQASIGAGIPIGVGCTTVNKVCGSGLKSVMLGYDSILAGHNEAVIAGGMESMSNAPYLLEKARGGYRLGHGKIADSMFLDGLEDAYDRGRLMGTFAEDTAQHYQFTRAQQDEFALRSLDRARKAGMDGSFSREIVSIVMDNKKEKITISSDEQPRNAKPEKIPTLKPAFRDGGTVTAANSSSISDGAAAVIVCSEAQMQKSGAKPLARIVAHATHAQEPAWFTTAPVFAIKKVAEKAGWNLKDVDLFEINEAFAVVTMAAQHELNLPNEKVNIRGGACAMGHPIGASGARVLVTLIHALQDMKLKRGIASLCIGGGEAVAMAIETI